MRKNMKYKLHKDNKIKVLFSNAKNKLFKNNRAFNMLKKGSRKCVSEGKVHRSIK